MRLPPADSPLRPFVETGPPHSDWEWAIGQPEVGGRLRLPPAAKQLIGHQPGQPVHVLGMCNQIALVLRPGGTGGARLRVDGHGRLSLPVWLRGRGPLAVGTNPDARVIVIALTGVLDPVGDLLTGARR